jgi:hypothetical protein
MNNVSANNDLNLSTSMIDKNCSRSHRSSLDMCKSIYYLITIFRQRKELEFIEDETTTQKLVLY